MGPLWRPRSLRNRFCTDVYKRQRVFWEGIACWPYLSHNLKTLKKYGINVCATAYARAWSLDYTPGDIESLARAYSFTSSNNILMDESIRRRKEWNEKFHIDGTIYHVNRACKVMVCQQQELSLIHIFPPLRERKEDIPVLTDFFLDKFCDRYSLQKKFAKRVYRTFEAYS